MAEDDKNRGLKWVSGFVGLSVLGAAAVGVLGFFAAILALLNETDYVGMGLLLLAAAVAFGLLTNALVRN
ncbi:MAG: hypothetical protein IIC78_07470 [Chloroflexi bacterium]|nr:hypothetical protein [Chloroflexota bacterium]